MQIGLDSLCAVGVRCQRGPCLCQLSVSLGQRVPRTLIGVHPRVLTRYTVLVLVLVLQGRRSMHVAAGRGTALALVQSAVAGAAAAGWGTSGGS